MEHTSCWYKGVCDEDSFGGCKPICHRFLEMNYLMENSHIPKARQGINKLYPPECDKLAYDTLASIKHNILDWVRGGNSLYICGSTTGNGKTSWAIKLMQSYFNSIWFGNGFRMRGIFVHVPTFLMKCKDFKTTDSEFELMKKDILNADLVIWDDLYTGDLSTFDYSQLLVYIDARCNEGLSNIYTCNIETQDELDGRLGTKISSRVFGKNTTVIELRGGDMR